MDHLALSDLGHAHVLVEQAAVAQRGDSVVAPLPPLSGLIGGRFHLLYHSAERLRLKAGMRRSEDPCPQMRILTRNFIGSPDGDIRIVHDISERSRSNTVGQIPGLIMTGHAICIAGNRRGCFDVQTPRGHIRFDVSFVSPRGGPGHVYEEQGFGARCCGSGPRRAL